MKPFVGQRILFEHSIVQQPQQTQFAGIITGNVYTDAPIATVRLTVFPPMMTAQHYAHVHYFPNREEAMSSIAKHYPVCYPNPNE